MLRERQQFLLLAWLGADGVAAILAFLIAYGLRFLTPLFPAPVEYPPLSRYLPLLLVVLPFQAFAFRLVGLYRTRRERSKADEAFAQLQGVTLTTILVVAVTFFIRSESYSRLVMLIFWGLDLALVFGFRLGIREILHHLRRHGRFLRSVLIVGAGPLGREVAQTLRGHPELGLRVVGFLDDQLPVGERVEGREVLGGYDAVRPVVQAHRVGQIFVALPLEAYQELMKILNTLEGELVDIKVVPDILQFITLRSTVEELDGLPIIGLSESPITGWPRVAKRVLDLACASLGLILLSPLLALITVAIKLSSPGPVLYRQERMGLDGRRFRIYKFRTMREGAEDETGPVWASADDRRKTRIGPILRELSLDELPQLWNVFRGEMSVVGPRPERPYFVDQFKAHVPQYMLRHKVKSGMTGWAQINGWRGQSSIERRIEYDLYYIENWSLAFDLKILILTLWRGWRDRHAY